MNFVWDSKKAASNLKKHGIGFEEASTVFLDPLALTGAAPDHSEGEARWLTFGVSVEGNFLVVPHNDEEDTIKGLQERLGRGVVLKVAETYHQEQYDVVAA